jgi:hypothetical protein
MRPESERRVVQHLAAGALNACHSTVEAFTGCGSRPTRGIGDHRLLIHSDGCRVLNRVNGKDYPRYLFDQVSDDTRRLFCDTCHRLGVEYTLSRWKTVSIARAASVALVDSFIGTKA